MSKAICCDRCGLFAKIPPSAMLENWIALGRNQCLEPDQQIALCPRYAGDFEKFLRCEQI